MTVDLHQAVRWATAAALLFAAFYLLATFKRSRRAATIGLFGLAVAGWLLRVGHEQVLESVGMAGGPTRRVTALWLHSAHMAVAHGLLLWAVVSDRGPPPADAD